ncbi:reverse transcriptase domain-containing protein [Tanacetum coccineum]
MEILPVSTSNSTADKSMALLPHSRFINTTCSYSSIDKDKYMMKAQGSRCSFADLSIVVVDLVVDLLVLIIIVCGLKEMEAGFLLGNNLSKKSGLAAKVKNIDGKLLGKDDKPLKAYRKTVRLNTNQVKLDGATCMNSTGLDIDGTNKSGACDAAGINDGTKQGTDNSILKHATPKKRATSVPIVESYVKNAWAKYGFERAILRNGFFFFKFLSNEGMVKILEGGPWFIRSMSICLNIWSADTKLKREDITRVPVWAKIHNVHVVAFSETGLSLITTQLGRPLMLDACTSDMYLNPWGRNTYARVLVELSSECAVVESLVVAIPLPKGEGHYLETLDVEYEWLTQIRYLGMVVCDADYKSKKKGMNKAAKAKHIEGIRFSKPQPKFMYRPVSKPNTNKENTSQLKANTPSFSKDGANGAGDQPNASPTMLMDDSYQCTNENGYFKDDIDLVQLRNNIEKLMDEDKVLDINTNNDMDVPEEVKGNDKGSLWEKFMKAQEASTSKPKSPMSDMDESDEDEVCMPDVMPGGGFLDGLEDDLDCYDGYEAQRNTPYLKTLKNSRPLPDFEEYVISTSVDTPCMILWSNIKKNTFSANTPYPRNQYSVSKETILRIDQYSVSEEPILRIGQYFVSEEPILCIGQYSISEDPIHSYWSIRRTVFGFPPYPFNYPTRRLTIEEMLAKFIDEGKREHEEMEIFIIEFRTTNELLLKERSNLSSELEIKNKPPRFEQDVQEKPHDDGVENKSSSILEKTTQPLVKPQQSSIPFPNRVRKEKEEALQRIFLENLKELDINISFIEALVCSTVLLNELPSKEKDPRSFTTPCQVFEKHKEAEDLAADHLSRFENPHMEVLTKREIFDKFSNEHLMALKSKFNNDEPWYADFVNYIVGKVVPPNWTFEKRKRFFSQVKTYFWEEPYAFKLCADNIMRRCVAGSETLEILAHCHSGPTDGHHSASVTAKKVYESGFYWPSVFKDANEYVCEVFDVWGLYFMGPFPQFKGNKYILVAVDYVSKWVEAQALPTNDARVVVKFLRQLFARFGVPKALISDRGTHFFNSQLEKALQRYGVGDKVLLYNSRLKMYPGKLKSKWSGPNIVKTMYPHGAIEITDRIEVSFKVNGQRLKKYYGGNIDKEDDEVIEFENGVT